MIRGAVARAVAHVAAGSTHVAAAKLEGISVSSIRRALHPPPRKPPRVPRPAPPASPRTCVQPTPPRPPAIVDAVLAAGLALIDLGRTTAEAAVELRRKGHKVTWAELHDARAIARRGAPAALPEEVVGEDVGALTLVESETVAKLRPHLALVDTREPHRHRLQRETEDVPLKAVFRDRHYDGLGPARRFKLSSLRIEVHRQQLAQPRESGCVIITYPAHVFSLSFLFCASALSVVPLVPRLAEPGQQIARP